MNFKVKFKEETPPFNVKFGWDNGEFEAGKAEAPIRYCETLTNVFYGAIFPEGYGFELRVEKVVPLYMAFRDAKNLKTLKIVANNIVGDGKCEFGYFAMSCRDLETVDFIQYNARPSSLDYAFFNDTKLKNILGVFDCTDCIRFNNTFLYCADLEEIRFVENTIKEVISFESCKKLSKVSITSVINALSDTEAGKTVTFSQAAKETAFTDAEWAALIGTKPNWTFSLA